MARSNALRKEIGNGHAGPPLTRKGIMDAIIKDARLSHSTIECLIQTMTEWTKDQDLEDIVCCWLNDYASAKLVAQIHPMQSMRDRFQAEIERRRRWMNSVLARVGSKDRIA